MSRPELVTCQLCREAWTAPAGTGRSSYARHYRENHRAELEAERRPA